MEQVFIVTRLQQYCLLEEELESFEQIRRHTYTSVQVQDTEVDNSRDIRSYERMKENKMTKLEITNDRVHQCSLV